MHGYKEQGGEYTKCGRKYACAMRSGRPAAFFALPGPLFVMADHLQKSWQDYKDSGGLRVAGEMLKNYKASERKCSIP